MPAVWSFNTTVRNPERVQKFLLTLSELEGKIFDQETQEEFFALQIKKRQYKPMASTLMDGGLIDEVNRESADEIPDEIVERIVDIYRPKSTNAAMRGRTTAGILNRFGLCVALESKGPVVITELGKNWIEGRINDQDLFLRFLLKWQYPNFVEDGYKSFDIKPFVGTLHLINQVNIEWARLGNKPVGLSKEETMLFVPSLSRYSELDRTAEMLIDYRKNVRKKNGKAKVKYQESFAKKRVKEIFGRSKSFSLAMRDLNDYRDSATKYFRMTRFIYKRGHGYIDIAPDYQIEAKRLMDTDDASAREYSNYQEYFNCLNNINLPDLPWENEDDLTLKINELKRKCKELSREIEGHSVEEVEKLVKDIEEFQLADQASKLEEIKNKLQIDRLKGLRYNNKKLRECIHGIENSMSKRPKIVTTRPSLDLEWFVSLSLMVLNDAVEINPSYVLGDDGIPSGFSSGVADIECYYASFKMIVEVTLMLSRDQWYHEGQPVMQHLRNFEDKTNTHEKAYCLFIAPFFHRGTLNTFWNSVKYEYEGKKQKIIPLKVEQYINILNIIEKKVLEGKVPRHNDYKKLLDSLYEESQNASDVYSWISGFDLKIDEWEKQV